MKLKDFIYFYRIRTRENKLGCLRPLGYTVLGYAIAAQFSFIPIFFNTLAILGVLMFGYAINDYYDFKLLGEENFISTKLKEGLKEKKALVFCYAPLVLLLPLFFLLSLPAFLLALLFTVLVATSIPPVRVKGTVFNHIIGPVCAPLLLLQAYLVLRSSLSFSVIPLAILVLIYQSYMESLHILDDAQEMGIRREGIFKLLKGLPVLSLVLSMAFALVNPIFLITTFFSLARIFALKKVSLNTNFLKLRSNLLHPAVLAQGLILYAVIGLFYPL